MVSLSAPLPHPTSSHWLPGGTASQTSSSRATSRLQRPTYDSYAAPLAHTSAGRDDSADIAFPFYVRQSCRWWSVRLLVCQLRPPYTGIRLGDGIERSA